MKKFFGEFKKFITRGNVMDLAVGVIIGGAFTAIVTALTANILQPLINWFLASVIGGEDALASAVTMLKPAYEADGVTINLASSIYIDWGAFISAVINFILVALVLFAIVKTINGVSNGNKKLGDELKEYKVARKEMKKAGLNYKNREEVKKYIAEKDAKAKAEADKLAEEQARSDAEAKKHTTEGLLEQIKELLEKQAK